MVPSVFPTAHFAGLPAACVAALPATASPLRPNIVFIVADDLGHGDVGAYGARSSLLKDMSTAEIAPTIRLVHQGNTAVPFRVAERLAEKAQRQALSPREQEGLQLLVRGCGHKEVGA